MLKQVSNDVSLKTFLKAVMLSGGCCLQFVDGAMNVMMLLDKQSGSVLQTINQGIKDIFGLDDKARDRANQSLRLFIENLVAQDFLPEVYVSFRYA